MIVVDASVLANVVGDDGADGDLARDALRGQDVAAPGLVDVEVVAVLRKRWLVGDLDDARFASAVEDLVDLDIDRHPLLPMLARAYVLRENVTPYDAMYVALAEALGCELLTGDRRLARAAGPECEVRVLGA